MNNLANLGFDIWFQDKIDLSKTDFNIVRVISVNLFVDVTPVPFSGSRTVT